MNNSLSSGASLKSKKTLKSPNKAHIPQHQDYSQHPHQTQQQSSKLRRGPWSPEEDKHLLDLVSLFGGEKNLNWVKISQMLETRSAKQARERYHQNLKPSLNRTPITPEEGLLIEELVDRYGKRWAEIARHLNGRSDNAIKNWWNGGASRRKRVSDKRGTAASDGDDDNVSSTVKEDEDDNTRPSSSATATNNNNDNIGNHTSVEMNTKSTPSNESNSSVSAASSANTLSFSNEKQRSASVDFKLPPLSSLPPTSLSGLGAANNLLSLNNPDGAANESTARKRKIKDDLVSKRRHSAASIGSVTSSMSSGFPLPHPSTSPYSGGLNALSSLTSIHNNGNSTNTTHLMSPPSSNLESMTSSPRGDSRSSRASSIGSGDLLANSFSTGDRDSSTSRRGSIWGVTGNYGHSNAGSFSAGAGLRRSSLNGLGNFSMSRHGSLGGRLSVTSLNQYSISQQQAQQSHISQTNNKIINSLNNTAHNNNNSSNTNADDGVNGETENANELKKDIFKKGFNLSSISANKPTSKGIEGPRGEYKDRDSADVSMDDGVDDDDDDDDIDKKESIGVSKEEGPKEGGKIKMKISSLVS